MELKSITTKKSNTALKASILSHLSEALHFSNMLDFEDELDEKESFVSDFNKINNRIFENLTTRISVDYTSLSSSSNDTLNNESFKDLAVLQAVINKLTNYVHFDFDDQLSILNVDNPIIVSICNTVNMVGEEMKEAIVELRKTNLELKELSRELDAKNRQAVADLKEKEVLLEEVHHRVKNNMQIIVGVIQMQKKRADSKEVKDQLKTTEIRIASMARIHEMLYDRDRIAGIEIVEFTESLLAIFANLYDKISININVDTHDFLSIDKAISYGLIINEILSNAEKHAGINSHIQINLCSVDECYVLSIQDNGPGFDVYATDKKSLGLKLVSLLKIKLQAETVFKNENGTLFEMKFTL